jgi:hypothetical protein
LLSFLEYTADTIITINSRDLLTILTRKSSGSVKTKQYSHELLKKSFALKEYKVERRTAEEEEQQIDPKMLGTFKISQKEDEVAARNKLILPFEYSR